VSCTRRAKPEVRSEALRSPTREGAKEGPKTGRRGARAALALLLLAGGALGQEKKKEEPPVPKILYFTPLAVAPGAKVKVTARGLNLDTASAVEAPGVEAAIKTKGKVTLPANTEPDQLGNSQVEVELKIPAELPEGTLALKLTNPAGTATHELRVVVGALPEKEPNNGFAQAQPVEAGKKVLGSVGGPKDVDVYRIDGKKGEVWSFEALAQRCGSPLDPLLSVYDASGRTVATRDDSAKDRDPRLELTLSADGPYYLTLLDAHDAGGNTHGYLLTFERR
jgi:hypothetical protein